MCDLALISIISYLLGSIPFSYVIARAYGRNLFEIGSRNIGAVNVYRATGKVEAFLGAVIGDVGKGSLAIFLAQKLGFLGYNLILAQALAAFFVVAGHNWPIFLKFTPLEKPAPAFSFSSKVRNFLTGFKGGRGLASLIGVILILNWKIVPLILGAVLFFILLTELIMKRGIKLEGNFKEKIKKLFSIFITQVLGRVIGLVAAVISVYLLYPQEFKIAIGATILAGIKHVKRTKEFLKKPNEAK